MSRPLHVLIVEDSVADAELLVHELRRGGYDPIWKRVDTAADMKAALEEQTWDLVVSDHSVLQFDSAAAMNLLKASNAETPFVIVSGTIGEERAVEAMKAGASDYLVKGRLGRLIPIVERELKDQQERRARRAAEQTIREHQQEAALQLAFAYEATIEGWARALDLRDHETEGHSRRVTDLSVQLARAMHLSDAECVHIRRGALLHDIGKMGIPDSILSKPAKLTGEELEVMRRHPQYARDLLAPITYLHPALDIPYSHHEKWDGSGYPQGLRGEQIPLAARIFAVVDIWDALRSNRPYRPAWKEHEARDHLASLSGTHLDPHVVEEFFRLLNTREAADHAGVGHANGPAAHTIFVVDDCQPNVRLIERWLADDGYKVLTADSGKSALDAVARHRPSLILLDVEMPAPNGLVVCSRLKQQPATAHIPIIILSGLDLSENESAKRAGADGYLMKPVDAFELRSRIRRILEERKAS